MSGNLAMEVLCSAPGSLQEQLSHLPQSLTSLAALAHIPTLAAGCSPAAECADQGASEGYTTLILCICTSPSEPVVEVGAADEAADSVAADGTAVASMWLQRAAIPDGNIVDGLFTLESRADVVVCRLLARVSALQGVTVCLPESACLLLGPGTLKLQGVTFQGADSLATYWP